MLFQRIRGVVLVALGVCAALPGRLPAQGLTGQISCTVQDPSGRLVAGAAVQLVNSQTGQSRQTRTDAQGHCAFTELLPGAYSVAVAVPGFKRYEQTDIQLTATERLALPPILLELGEVQQTVSVTAPAARVQTESSERSGLISATQVEELPTKGRDFLDAVRLLPGVVDTGAHDAPGGQNLGNIRINGVRQGMINMALDGTAALDVGNMFQNLIGPNIEAISEVKVLLNSFQAEYGRSAGATINVVTRGGSRTFHGGFAYFKRNEFFNANNYFNNRNGLPRPYYRYDYPSFNFGGPVLIPGTNFNRNRDKLFFFYSQDFLPRSLPTNQAQRTFPTALERQGNFSQSVDTNGALIPILDPLNNRAPFPGNIVPANRVDRNGQGLLNVFPLPNAFDPTHTYNSVFQSTIEQPRHEEILRLDWNINPSTTFYWRGIDSWSSRNGDFMTVLASNSWPQFAIQFPGDSRNVSSSLIHTFSPTLVNEATFGVTRVVSAVQPASQQALDKNNRAKLGLNIPQLYPQINPLNVLPNAMFGGVPNAPVLSIEQRFPYFGHFNTWVFSDNLSKVYGPHNLKAGIYFEKDSNNKALTSAFNGTFDFSRDPNNPVDANYAFANALLGQVRSYTESNLHPIGHGRFSNLEWFAQDNWKITRRLTLDIGMRFYRQVPVFSAGDRIPSFVPQSYDPSAAPQLIRPYKATASSPRVGINPHTGEVAPAVLIGAFAPGGGNFYDGIQIFNEHLLQTPPIQLSPRFGFAWDVFGNGKTALRGGFASLPDVFRLDLLALWEQQRSRFITIGAV